MGFFGNKEKRNRDVCPYCNIIFPKPPKRKTKCEKCGKECFIRTTQVIFNSDILTQEEALAADFFKELQYLGATIDDYLKVEAELSQKWGTEPKSYDIVWRVSNRLIMQPPKVENDYDPKTSLLQHAKMVAIAQAMYQAKRGNDPYSYLKNARNYDIQIGVNREFPVSHFEIETQRCCKACSKHQGEKYTAEELGKDPILPIKGCINKINQENKYAWCTCWYSPRTL